MAAGRTTSSRTTSPSPTLLPTDADVAFYDEHGWWISPVVLPPDEVDAGLQAALRFYDRPDRTLPVATGYANWQHSDGLNVPRHSQFVALQSDALRRLVCWPTIGAIAGRLARTQEIRLLNDQLVYKPPSTVDSASGWHADHAYWGTCSSDRLLTAWIPLQDVDESSAPLVVLDGSHKWSGTEHARFYWDPNLATARFERHDRQLQEVALTLKKGQVSFHHGWTVHASYPNRAELPRIALGVHLQDESNAYRAALDQRGNPVQMFDELLCRKLANGQPDFTDPAVFPVIWRGIS